MRGRFAEYLLATLKCELCGDLKKKKNILMMDKQRMLRQHLCCQKISTIHLLDHIAAIRAIKFWSFKKSIHHSIPDMAVKDNSTSASKSKKKQLSYTIFQRFFLLSKSAGYSSCRWREARAPVEEKKSNLLTSLGAVWLTTIVSNAWEKLRPSLADNIK